MALLLLCTAAWGAEEAEKPDLTPQPWVTMSLRTLGVPSIPESFLQVGASMLTLDLVDDTHLLLTFSSRGLVPRDKDDLPGEESRMVAAELVELPTGKILAHADWKMHDHGRYLWRMGKGRFLMRTRNKLFVIAPLSRLNTPDPLRPLPFPSRDGMPVAAVISPDMTMLTVETKPPEKKAKIATAAGTIVVNDPKPTVMLDFYRLNGGDAPGVPLSLTPSGSVRAPGPLMLPMDADGYLWPNEGQHGRWPVSFNEFGGREVKIGAIDSSCPPRLQMVSRFEFLAFTCRGTESRVRLKSYGMDGHETWEETLSGTYGLPELAFAPEAGRFALSRIMSPSGDLMLGQIIPDGATQEVRVYQTESGELLLKVPTTPVTRYAENFDLSLDGSVAAVVSNGTVQVYKLPAPSAQDMKDLQEAKSFSPPVSIMAVSFAKLENRRGGTESEGTESAAASAPAGTDAGSPAAEKDVASGSPAAADVASAGVGSGGGKPPATAMAKTDAGEAGGPAASEARQTAAASIPGGVRAAADRAVGDPPGDGDAAVDGAKRRGPPTLLEPGEKVEKVRSPAQR